MKLFDSFLIDGVRRTADGYLAAHAKVARTGIQVYKGSELGRPDLGEVRVYRPPEEVFHADALKSFAHRPITLKHPRENVTSKNWKRYAGGQTGDEIVRDGQYVRVPMLMMDQGLIDAYEKGGIKELSMGYSTDLKWRTGVTDAGETYDAVQTEIRGNHLAVVPTARGGDQLRIGDNKSFRAMVDKLKAEEPDDDEDMDDEDMDYVSDAHMFYDTEFTEEQRTKLAKSGAAMPGGGFPIRNAEDLHHAMQAIGRAKNPDAARAHIRSRAKALGLESELSSSFKDARFSDFGDSNMRVFGSDAWSDEARAAALEARRAKSHHSQMADKHAVRYTEAYPKSAQQQHQSASEQHAMAAHHFGRADEEYKAGHMKEGDRYSALAKKAGAKADKSSEKLGVKSKTKDSSSISDVDYVDCPECGAEVPSDDTRCPECGALISPTRDGVTIMKVLTIDGVPVQVADDQTAAVIARHISKMEGDLKVANDAVAASKVETDKANQLVADAKTVVGAKDGEIVALKAQLKDAEISPEKLDVLVKDRVAVIDRAKTLLPQNYIFDGKKVEDIRRAAVAVKVTDSVASAMDDANVNGAFLALTTEVRGGGARPFADALRRQTIERAGVTDGREAAYDESIKRLNDAWKTKPASAA